MSHYKVRGNPGYTFIILADKPMPNYKKLGPVCCMQYKQGILLDKQVEEILRFDKNAEIVLVVGFDGEIVTQRLCNRNIRIVENPNYNSTGDAESIRLGLNASSGNSIFIQCGLSLISHSELIPLSHNNSLLVNKERTKNIGVVADGHRALSFSFKAKNSWMNICFLKNTENLRSKINIVNKNLAMYEVLEPMIDDKMYIVNNESSKIIECPGDLN